MIKNIDDRLFFDGNVIEFDGTHYAMPLGPIEAEQWHELVKLVVDSVDAVKLAEILEMCEGLEFGELEPDMITEEVALNDDYLMITPMSQETVYIEHECEYGNTVGYQIGNIFAIDSLLIWLGVFPKDSLNVILTYLESINPAYKEDYEWGDSSVDVM